MTETQSIPRLLPTLTETNTPFWTRGRQNELVILRHRETGAWVHPPELAESGDNGGDNNIVPEVVSGKGTVMTFTVQNSLKNSVKNSVMVSTSLPTEWVPIVILK